MNISYIPRVELLEDLQTRDANSLEFIMLVTGALDLYDSQAVLLLLQEAVRVLKHGGIVFVQGIPKVLPALGVFLEKYLNFKYWFAANYDSISPIDARYYCLRTSCMRKRKQQGDNDKTALHDIWWDVHRIKHRRDRDYHPCQLPQPLMERIIRLATNPGDVVLDAFGGTGTTPLTALQLGRQYVAIDLDANYVKIMQEKIAQVKDIGQIQRHSVKHVSRKVSIKALQLELRQITADLGRLPTPEDVKDKSRYDLDLFLETFSTWGKALKAAKLEITS